MKIVRPNRQSGFTILEALVALVVVAFGMLALAGMQTTLSRNADVARQRTEAMRLAQQQIENMRSFVGVASGAINWNGLAASTTTVAASSTNGYNTDYTVATTMGGAIADAMRSVNVAVSWTDRANEAQSISISSVISKTDPSDSGFLGNPLPQNTNLKRPKNRNINIPIPALSLPGGKSAFQLSPTLAIIFDDSSANVIQKCNTTVTALTNLTTSCTTISGYVVAGYIQRASNSVTWPTGIYTADISRNTTTADPINCEYVDAVDQNTGSTIANYKYYLCVIPLASPWTWSGRVRLGGMLTTDNYYACRFQYTATTVTVNERNVQDYTAVNMSLDEQNYYINNAANLSCSAATVSGISTGVLHQNCKSTNASRATECPA